MDIHDFIAARRDEIIACWRTTVKERLRLDLERSELLNDLPNFLDELADALRSTSGQWPEMEGARNHGRQRLRLGVDIGGLTEEMTLVGEAVLGVATTAGVSFPEGDVARLFHCLGRGAAVSVRAYASLRDIELATQAAASYSFIAHEIRTPLHTARLAAELMTTASGEEQDRYRRRLFRALARVSELVDDSISHARLQGNPRIAASLLNARELAAHAIEDIDDHARARGVQIRADAEELEFTADQKLLRTVLVNLLRNAVKFSREHGQISLRISAQEDRVLIEVHDSCGGIAEEVLPTLFQPFAQRHADTSGFGLGLLIVKEAVEAHHGAVRIVNRPPDGCTFVAELPLHYESDD